MFTPFIKDWQYYGYGWWITNRVINHDTLTFVSHGGSTDGYKAYFTRIVQDSIDIMLFQNNYYRTELGVKFDYFTTNEIINILYGKEYSLPKKSIAKEIGYCIGQKGLDAAIDTYNALKKNKSYFVDDYELSQLGKELYYQYHLKNESTKIFEIGLLEYPNSFLLNYSYGDMLADAKDAKADLYLKKCIQEYGSSPDNKEYSQEYDRAVKMVGNK